MALTGRYRYRRSLLGHIILQLEHDERIPWPLPRHGQHRQVWRNARNSDLLQPEVRGILEMREVIQQLPEANYGAPRAPLTRLFSPEAKVPRPRVVPDEPPREASSSA